MTRRSCVLALAAAPTALSKNWDEPAFPNWNVATVEKLLTDSPWSRPFTAKFDSVFSGPISRANYFQIPGWPGVGGRTRGGSSPSVGGGASVRTEAYLTIRWASALPVRQAMALHDYGKAGLDDPRAVELISKEPDEYVLELAGFPATLVGDKPAQLERELKRTARLWLPGEKPLAPTDVYLPEYGMHLLATLRFPRVQVSNPGDASAELIASTPWFRIEQKFKLKSMVYQEALAL